MQKDVRSATKAFVFKPEPCCSTQQARVWPVAAKWITDAVVMYDDMAVVHT